MYSNNEVNLNLFRAVTVQVICPVLVTNCKHAKTNNQHNLNIKQGKATQHNNQHCLMPNKLPPNKTNPSSFTPDTELFAQK
jgi:hypothetical protein